MIGDKTKPLVVYVPEELKEQITELAKRDGRSASNYVLQLIQKDIEKKSEK